MFNRSILSLALLSVLCGTFALAQEDSSKASDLAKKCGSEIQWVDDLDTAKQKAKEKGRLVLWYISKVVQSSGFQGPMYKAQVLNKYMYEGPFMDEDLIQLMNRKFVPVALPHKDALSKVKDLAKELNLTRFNFFEPAFVFMTPDGKVVHKLDRIRTFDGEFLAHTLRSVLAKNPENKGAEKIEVQEHILDGNYTKAEELLKGASDASGHTQLAGVYRRMRKWDQALASVKKAQESARDDKTKGDLLVEEALILQKSGKLSEAEKLYSQAVKNHSGSPRHAEAQYRLGAIMYLSARESEAKKLWQELVSKHGEESRWAWKAAAEMIGPGPSGHAPLVHTYEPLVSSDEEVFTDLPTHTARKRSEKDTPDMVHDAVEFLLTHQRSDGLWKDSQYDFMGKQHIPNTWMAITAIASMGLLAWKDVDPRIQKALEKSEQAMMDSSRLADKVERAYAHAYRLMYFSRRIKEAGEGEKKKYLGALNSIVKALMSDQGKGFWMHEYENPFVTATALIGLHEAKQAGAEVSAPQNAVNSLKKARGKNGTFPYDKGTGGPIQAAGRMPLCELALYVHSASSMENLENAVEKYFENEKYYERSRYYDYHADNYANAGFFFYYNFQAATETILLLKDDLRKKYFKETLDFMLNVQEIDGSFIDDHELGKSYATGLALGILKNCGASISTQSPIK